MGLATPISNAFKSLKSRDMAKIMWAHLTTAKCNSTSIEQKLDNGLNALQKSSDDLSIVTPYFTNTFNIAAYVNSSETLQKLMHLNVDLNKIERKPYVVDKILKLDFDEHMKDHILFISDYVDMEQIGNFITKNPLILCEPLEDIQVRINYLLSKKFSNDQIKRIITKNPFWLMFSTVRIDRRLGYFQECLDLNGMELRQIATKQPKLITYNLHHIKSNLFVLKEEMGFEDKEIKETVINKPKVLMISQKSLLEAFNYIHNTMKISHTTILANPGILFCRSFKLKQRHLFLEKLGRAQYDPKKENYVPIMSLVEGTDSEFCQKFAKCTVSDFNMFLKTL